eukprot:1159478-Pelagomonas_calceolata.AAC.14
MNLCSIATQSAPPCALVARFLAGADAVAALQAPVVFCLILVPTASILQVTPEELKLLLTCMLLFGGHVLQDLKFNEYACAAGVVHARNERGKLQLARHNDGE